MKLVIVESPAKAKTINKYLGKDYKVIASYGHVKDIPSKNGSVIPEEDFFIKYEIPEQSKKHADKIIEEAKKADEVYLATDPDREGEAISWHVIQLLKENKVIKDDNKFKRVAFNEITKRAVADAINNPRNIDQDLVDAQQARRALDYLVGFNLSPILWRKLPGCRSAGRVQSVALRMVCEREEEIESFESQEYWDISLDMKALNGKKLLSKISHVDDNKLEKFSIKDEDNAKKLAGRIDGQKFYVKSVEKKQQKRNPSPPFITSSLQQEAARKLGFSAKQTMQHAQKLYEGIDIDGETIGLITYMRTDGVTLSKDSIGDIRKLIKDKYGNDYLPEKERVYKSKSKNAQEAHEAIRPTDIFMTPQKVKKFLTTAQFSLYELIWKRSVACQMESAIIDIVKAEFISENKDFIARATGSTIAFDGFYCLYKEGVDDQKEEEIKILPVLKEGELVNVEKILPAQHFTEPPPKYSESSLVKKLEDEGIGRPSTYASIISVLQDRKYTSVDKKRFNTSDLGRIVTVFLKKFFTRYVEYNFTANLEQDLDKIAAGEVKYKDLLKQFWQNFSRNVTEVGDISITDILEYISDELDSYIFGDKKDINEYNKRKKCSTCSDGKLEFKIGKYGAFLACNNYPDCKYNRKLHDDPNSDTEIQQADKKANEKSLGEDAEGNDVILKKGPYGWYIQLGDVKNDKGKPKRAPIPANISPENIDKALALKILNLPILVGVHSDTGEEISMGIGKYGPYVKYEGKFISIPKNIDPFAISLTEAEDLIEKKFKKEHDKDK